MGVRFARQKPRHWLYSLAYKVNAALPLSVEKKLDLWLNLERIAERLAHESSGRAGLSRLQMNRFLLDRIKPDDFILDLGCSTGEISAELAKRAQRVVGVDHNAARLAAARRAYPSIDFVESDAEDYLKLTGAKFNVLIMSHVLEHLDHPDTVFQLAHKFERTYIEVPDFDSSHLNHVRKARNLGLIYTDNDHIAEFDRIEMAEMLERNGLEVEASEYKLGLMRLWIGPQQPLRTQLGV